MLFLLISYYLCFSLLTDLLSSCRGDWDYFFSLYEVASVSILKYGQFPLWNPYCGGGISIIGNPQAGFISPIGLLTLIFGVVPGLKIAVWLHTLLGLIGMWLLGKHMGIRGPAEIVPPLIFMLSSTWSLHIAEGHIVWLPASILPYCFLTYLKGLKNSNWLFMSAGLGSLILYEGGTYVFAFSMIFITIYAIINSLESRHIKPLIAFLATTILSLLLSAPKLLPSLELLRNNPRITESGTGITWYDFLLIILDREQTLSRSIHGTGWWEYGCYLGIIGIALYLYSFRYFKSYKSLSISSICIMLICVGNFSRFSPWNLLHSLPFFNFLKVPTRCLIIFCFTVALLVGLSLSNFCRKPSKGTKIFVAILILALGIDLFSVSYKVLAEANKAGGIFSNKSLGQHPELNQKPPELYKLSSKEILRVGNIAPSAHEPFSQTSIPISMRNIHGAWSDQYLPLLHNKGVVDAYETIPYKRYALPENVADYKGEFYLLGNGSVVLQHWSPNKLAFKINTKANNTLVINQNFSSGWHARRGMIKIYKGLLSIDLEKGDYEVSVSYLPSSFLVGICILFVTVFTLIFILWKNRHKND